MKKITIAACMFLTALQIFGSANKYMPPTLPRRKKPISMSIPLPRGLCYIKDINARMGDDSIHLHGFAKENKPQLIQYLVDAGLDVNATNKVGLTPLHVAGAYDSKEAAERLIRLGADVNAQCKRGRTSLHLASRCKSQEVVQLFIKHHANLNLQNDNGSTALHKAVGVSADEVIKLLIGAGADRTIKTIKEQQTAKDCIDNTETRTVFELAEKQFDATQKHAAIKIQKLHRAHKDRKNI